MRARAADAGRFAHARAGRTRLRRALRRRSAPRATAPTIKGRCGRGCCGAFVQAHLNVYDDPARRAARSSRRWPTRSTATAIGTLGEIFDGDRRTQRAARSRRRGALPNCSRRCRPPAAVNPAASGLGAFLARRPFRRSLLRPRRANRLVHLEPGVEEEVAVHLLADRRRIVVHTGYSSMPLMTAGTPI